MDCPGNLHCPCAKNEDCFSGFCMETMFGNECSKECLEEGDCPKGWTCQVCGTMGGDPFYCCVPPFQRLCQPCRTDQECIPPYGAVGKKYLCIEFGPEGSFCGTECANDSECPKDFECVPVEEGRGQVKQCRPAGGASCPCTEKYAKGGFVTDCYHQNEHGVCRGQRTCNSVCDAKVPAQEACNLEDDDCNGKVDDNVSSKSCPLENGYGVCEGQTRCIAGEEVCQGTYAAPEVCNGQDDDCDGQVDEEGAPGCREYYRDEDQDGFGVSGDSRCLCAADWPYTATVAGDCHDQDPDVHPAGNEVCNAKDDDCDGQVDEEGALGCALFYQDNDQDGWGAGNSKCLCSPAPPFTASIPGDCDDHNADINVGGEEACNDLDDDCDGQVDEEGALGCTLFYQDNDQDGWGTDQARCLCFSGVPWTASTPGDCDDSEPLFHPGRKEVCNEADDDCDGLVDEGCNFVGVSVTAAGCAVRVPSEDLSPRFDALLGAGPGAPPAAAGGGYVLELGPYPTLMVP